MKLALLVLFAGLKLSLLSYEGLEYTLHLEDSQVWYEYQNRQLNRRKLSPAELQRVERVLQQEHFDTLPARLSYPSCDSSWTLTVGKRSVFATTMAPPGQAGPHRRFVHIVRTLQAVAPIPKLTDPR